MTKVLLSENSWCKVEVDDKTGERFITTKDAKAPKVKATKEEKKDEE